MGTRHRIDLSSLKKLRLPLKLEQKKVFSLYFVR
jgi:hypothetical protein